MVATQEVANLKDRILTRIADAARSGNVPELATLTARATECERLMRELRDIDDRYASLSAFVQGPTPDTRTQPTPSASRGRSAKRDGAEMRAQWVEDMKSKGIVLRGYGKRYTTESGATVGLAPANELDGKPNKWFSGLADEPTDIAVLLCRSGAGRMYDLVLPVADMGRRWDLLSRAGGQIKFNVRKDVAEFFLLIPGNDPLNITQYLSNYDALRRGMQSTRQLLIDGDEVTFEIKFSGQAMAVPGNGRTDSPEPFLGATARRDGKKDWSGVVTPDVLPLQSIHEQFSDRDLERLYRQCRAVR